MTRGDVKTTLKRDGIPIRPMRSIDEISKKVEEHNRRTSHDVTREVAEQAKKQRPTPEQLAEIHTVRSRFSPWTHIYLLRDKKCMQEAGAERMLISFNEELDKSIRQQPRQHASALIAKSFENTQKRVRDDPQTNSEEKAVYLQALDTLQGRITGILSGKELTKKQKRLVAINTKIIAFKTHLVGADINTLVKDLAAKHQELADINQMIDAFKYVTSR